MKNVSQDKIECTAMDGWRESMKEGNERKLVLMD